LTLGIILVGSLLLAVVAGADLRALADVRLRATWLIIVAFALQLLVFAVPWTTKVLSGAAADVHMASYGLLLVFATANLSQPGFGLATLGLTLNTIAIAANNGRMPVLLSVWETTGKASSDITRTGKYNNNVLATAHTHLGFLGDVFPLPASFPLSNSFSVGDILLLLGGTFFVYRRCRPSRSASTAIVPKSPSS
jgi:Family of unknown function (DUF5317)